jgi:uncharacterized protein YbbC (DUF1343 family)
VGLYDLPLQYGLTLGELGHLFVERDRSLVHKPVNYSVVPVPGLCRSLPTSTIQRDWYSEHVYAFLPSPNMPSPGECTLPMLITRFIICPHTVLWCRVRYK